MNENILMRLIEHNHWANLQILEICETLTEDQLDIQPQSAVHGTIRETLQHLVTSQEDYTSMLTKFTTIPEKEYTPTIPELREILITSGKELVSLVQDPSNNLLQAQIILNDGYKVEPWVLLTQVINHATEHREQIKSMITALGIKPPRVDGWFYARECNALFPPNS